MVGPDPARSPVTVAVRDDVDRYREILHATEREARRLAWSAERPWKSHERVVWENGLPVIDLHDLGTAEGAATVRRVVDAPPSCGAVVFVYGRGRSTRSAGTPLRSAVHRELERACDRHPGWAIRMHGLARAVLVTDASVAPPSASGAWSPWLWIGWALLVAAFVLAVLRNLLR
jgi:hypothetical protein